MPTQITPKRKKAKFFWIVLILLGAGFATDRYLKHKAEEPYNQPEVVLQRFQDQRTLMGTLATITVYAETEAQANQAIAAAFVRGEEVNFVASDYLAESELSRFNSTSQDVWFSASDDLLTLVSYGLELAELTNGAYDPTLGTLTHLWRETKKSSRLPSSKILDEALAHSGWELLKVDLKSKKIRKLKKGVRLDLGGLAKGYAADQMLEVLGKNNLERALVLLGGDVRCGNSPPNKEGWMIGLRGFNGDLSEVISVANCAVSTSGDFEQFVELEGRRYSHVLDPRTGLGTTDSLLATVVAQNGLMADPLATAACVNPVFFSEISPATNIHSRILSVRDQQISSGFPQLSRYAEAAK